MSGDFDKPGLDDAYTDVLPDIRANQDILATMFNTGAALNTPVNAVQFLGGSFALYNGASFDITAVAVAGGGTGSTNAAGARSNLDVLSSTELDAAYMRQDSNGSDIDDASIFRTNIDVYSTSQVYTQTEVNTIVEFASQAQAEAGVNSTAYMNPLRTEQAIQAIGRTPVTIWTGSDSSVSDAEILASSGFSVVPGRYFLTNGTIDFSIDVVDTTRASNGSSSVSIASNLLIIVAASRDSGLFIIERGIQSDAAVTLVAMTEIKFTPL